MDTKKEKRPSLEEAIKALNKKYDGEGVVRVGDMARANVEALSTNCFSLDYVFGCGGLPRGRIIELFGQESCLDGDTFISYDVRNKDGKSHNHKGGTIKRLYERFHRLEIEGKGNYQKKQSIDADFYVSSINENNAVIKNKVLDVVNCGIKECLKVITVGGKKIVCTKDHKFYAGNGNYFPLEKLSVGSVIYVHNNTNVTGRRPQIRYKEILVKYHPKASIKIVNGCTYYRVKMSHLVYESNKNLFCPLSEYIDFLNTRDKDEIDRLWTVPKGFHIHHKNFDPHDDRLENLELILGKKHNRMHALNNGDKLNFVVTEDVIKSIKRVGLIPTYDIKCQFPYNNYIANKIVVHNSGKSTLALYIISQVQKQGGKAVFIDAEFAFKADYAKACGVNIDDLYVSQPSNGEEALDIVRGIVESAGADIIVVDSVASLVPKKEIEEELEKDGIALQARMMSKALRVLTGEVAKSKTVVIFINQIREKVGVYFGNKNTTSGGKALKFYSSVRLEVKKGEKIKGKNDEVIGNWLSICGVKNKVGYPWRVAEIEIIYSKGIDVIGDILDSAARSGVVSKFGGNYSYGDKKLGSSRDSAKKYLEEHVDISEEIKNKLK